MNFSIPNWKFQPAPKIHPLSTRTMSHAQTEQRVGPVIAQVPITRLSDLTPLDPIALPVFSATTPLARDLTTHMGKGLDASSARLSAIMEAIERVSAEHAPDPGMTDTYDALKTKPEGVVDPARFDLPSDSRYRPDRAIAWTRGHELLSDSPTWLPLDLAISPPRGEVLNAVDTNGLASGNSLLEAVTHGLCEVVERDAISQLEFVASFGQSDGARYGSLDRREHNARGGQVLASAPPRKPVTSSSIEDVTTELGVATFRSHAD